MKKLFLTMLVFGILGVSNLSAQEYEYDWMKMVTFDQEMVDSKRRIYSDESGNTYSTFMFQWDIHLGRPPKKKKDPEPPTLSTDNSLYAIYLDKRNSDGDVEWAKAIRLGDPDKADNFIGLYNTCSDVIIDGGDIYITGTFDYSMDFGNGISLTSEGRSDMYIAKINSSGDTQWAVRAGGPGIEMAENDAGGVAIAADGKGSVYATGILNAYPNGGGTIADQGLDLSKDGGHAVVIKLSSDGKVQWTKKAAAGTLLPTGLNVDGNGNVYISGSAQFVIEWDGNQIEVGGLRDAVIIKMDPDGNHLWSKAMGLGDGKNLDNEAVNLMTVADNGDIAASVTVYDGAEIGGTKIEVDKKNPMKLVTLMVNLDGDGNVTGITKFDGPFIFLPSFMAPGFTIGDKLFFKIGRKVEINGEKSKEGLYSIDCDGNVNYLMSMRIKDLGGIHTFMEGDFTINSNGELFGLGNVILTSELIAFASKKAGERYQKQINKNYYYNKDFDQGVVLVKYGKK